MITPNDGAHSVKEWYALHTKPYSERKVAVRLDRHDDIETYVPEAKSDAKHSQGRRVPFFPGYMFIRLDMQEANPNRWRYAPGVRYIVSYGDEPIAVSEDLIRTIQKQLATLQNQQESSRLAQFKPGDRVRVTTGPLQDMLAIFEGPTEPAERVRILLETMSQYRRVRISKDALEKVDSKEDKPKKKRPRRTRGRGRPIHSN